MQGYNTSALQELEILPRKAIETLGNNPTNYLIPDFRWEYLSIFESPQLMNANPTNKAADPRLLLIGLQCNCTSMCLSRFLRYNFFL